MSAIDAIHETLEFAKLRPNAENVNFQLASAYELPDTLGLFNAAFAGLWLSHVPIEGRHNFMDSLHARLLPGSIVIFIDNAGIQCREYPVVETDSQGNTYQNRALRDGSTHRVLKNFPTRPELDTMIEGRGKNAFFCELENFWVYGYET
jgi:hypothetical protein